MTITKHNFLIPMLFHLFVGFTYLGYANKNESRYCISTLPAHNVLVQYRYIKKWLSCLLFSNNLSAVAKDLVSNLDIPQPQTSTKF